MPEEAVVPVEIPMAGGKVSSTRAPAFQLIPTEALLRLIARFELGRERKKEKAWNARSENQEVLLDREFAIERIDHLMRHALTLRDKIQRGAPMEGDDDAAAISWSGAFLCCATKAMAEATPDEQKNCSACGGSGRCSYPRVADGQSYAGMMICPACRGTGKGGPKTS